MSDAPSRDEIRAFVLAELAGQASQGEVGEKAALADYEPGPLMAAAADRFMLGPSLPPDVAGSATAAELIDGLFRLTRPSVGGFDLGWPSDGGAGRC
ncbi:MAG TPA: hypothetical protein VEA60_10260 [Allosphingosinicella sp.]|nr:hypothetical protein [Allosphingosinicella sp.]